MEIEKTCIITQKVVCDNLDCGVCKVRRFYFHPFAKYYSAKNEVDVTKITRGTERKICLDCDECGAELWVQTHKLMNMDISSSMTHCKYCNLKRKMKETQIKRENNKRCTPKGRLCSNINCVICTPRRFVNHEYSGYFSTKNTIDINQISLSSHKVCIFNCPQCNIEINLSVYNYLQYKGGRCSNCNIINRMNLIKEIEDGKCKPTSIVLCSDVACLYCPQRKFANHRFAVCYSSKNTEDIQQVKINSGLKYYLNCMECGKEHHLIMNKITKLREQHTFCDDCQTTKNNINKINKQIEKEKENQKCSMKKRTLCENQECEICGPRRFSNHPFAKYYSIKNEDDIRNITIGNGKSYIFECDICNHETINIINSFNDTDKHFCKYCSKRELCGNKECMTCWNNSFASHEKSQFWSPKNEIKPWQVLKGIFRTKYLFDCNICGHEFWGRLSHITNPNEESWCPFCHTESLCQTPCDICFKKSFASHEKSKCWSDKNELKPFQIRLGSNTKFIFDCDVCFHTFEMAPSNITNKNLSHWCPYCSNTKLCENLDCLYCFNRSFASLSHSKYWSDKNKITPRFVFKKTNKKYLFDCELCEMEYEGSLAGIFFRNIGCSVCTLKTEKNVFKFLKDNTNYNIVKNPKFDWCRNPYTNRYLPFDILIEELNILIEIDGLQHFQEVKIWKSNTELNQNRDLFKMRKARENGHTLIRCVQTDIHLNKYDWRSELLSHIKEYTDTSFIFMCKKNEYEPYIQKLDSLNSITLDKEYQNETE